MSTPVSLKKLEERKNNQHKGSNSQPLLSQLQSYRTLYRGQVESYTSLGSNYTAYRQPRIDFTSDTTTPLDRHFTSFDQRRKKQRNFGLPQPRLTPQVVVKPDDNIPTYDFIISPDNIYCFSGNNNFMGAHYPCSLLIDGYEYKSVEHYYQACKLFSLAGSVHALELRNIENPLKVKTKAKAILQNLKIGRDTIEEWKQTQGYLIYKHATIHKFIQNEDLRKMLLETGDKILAHAYDRDSLFACGMDEAQLKTWAKEKNGTMIQYPQINGHEDIKFLPLTGKGKNVFGMTCMQIRKQIRDMLERNTSGDGRKLKVENFLPNLSVAMSTMSLASVAEEDEGKEKENSEVIPDEKSAPTPKYMILKRADNGTKE